MSAHHASIPRNAAHANVGSVESDACRRHAPAPPVSVRRAVSGPSIETGYLIESLMSQGDREHRDRNGFVTALGVRTLRRCGLAVPGALFDALLRCRSAQGGFRFWPIDARPHWAPDLPDDVDDTAIMALELLHAGRLSLDEARRIACLIIARRRIATLPVLRPPWLRTGVFATWSRDNRPSDMVDCTATANVLGLLAAVGLSHLPGVREAISMLEAAVAWAGDDELRATSLSPFYPDPAEFVLALEHAADAGATRLGDLHTVVASTSWGRDARALSARAEHPVCSSPYGVAVWRSSELARLRKWAWSVAAEKQPKTFPYRFAACDFAEGPANVL